MGVPLQFRDFVQQTLPSKQAMPKLDAFQTEKFMLRTLQTVRLVSLVGNPGSGGLDGVITVSKP